MAKIHSCSTRQVSFLGIERVIYWTKLVTGIGDTCFEEKGVAGWGQKSIDLKLGATVDVLHKRTDLKLGLNPPERMWLYSKDLWDHRSTPDTSPLVPLRS